MQIALLEHSAILLTCINWILGLEKQFFVFFMWPLKTGFTVYTYGPAHSMQANTSNECLC